MWKLRSRGPSQRQEGLEEGGEEDQVSTWIRLYMMRREIATPGGGVARVAIVVSEMASPPTPTSCDLLLRCIVYVVDVRGEFVDAMFDDANI